MSDEKTDQPERHDEDTPEEKPKPPPERRPAPPVQVEQSRTPVKDFGVLFEERGSPEQLAALDAALAKAAAEFDEIQKDTPGQIGHQLFVYAPLCVLTRATRKALSKHGVTVNQFLTSSPDYRYQRLTQRVAGHGARIITHFDFVRINDIKEYGKVTTYARRYNYQAFGVLDGEDADDPDQKEGKDGKRR